MGEANSSISREAVEDDVQSWAAHHGACPPLSSSFGRVSSAGCSGKSDRLGSTDGYKGISPGIGSARRQAQYVKPGEECCSSLSRWRFQLFQRPYRTESIPSTTGRVRIPPHLTVSLYAHVIAQVALMLAEGDSIYKCRAETETKGRLPLPWSRSGSCHYENL